MEGECVADFAAKGGFCEKTGPYIADPPGDEENEDVFEEDESVEDDVDDVAVDVVAELDGGSVEGIEHGAVALFEFGGDGGAHEKELVAQGPLPFFPDERCWLDHGIAVGEFAGNNVFVANQQIGGMVSVVFGVIDEISPARVLVVDGVFDAEAFNNVAGHQ